MAYGQCARGWPCSNRCLSTYSHTFTLVYSRHPSSITQWNGVLVNVHLRKKRHDLNWQRHFFMLLTHMFCVEFSFILLEEMLKKRFFKLPSLMSEIIYGRLISKLSWDLLQHYDPPNVAAFYFWVKRFEYWNYSVCYCIFCSSEAEDANFVLIGFMMECYGWIKSWLYFIWLYF